MESKKLYKSRNRLLCGVCGGIAEYINLDPTIVRLLFALFAFTSATVFVYIIAAIIMPEDNRY